MILRHFEKGEGKKANMDERLRNVDEVLKVNLKQKDASCALRARWKNKIVRLKVYNISLLKLYMEK